MSRRLRQLALAGATCFASGGCLLFVPETHDRIELATAQARDTCKGAELDPKVIGPEAIDRVEPLYSSVPSRSGYDQHFLGARLRIRPTPGMTAELLERTLRCHAARQTLGTEAAVASDPYVLPNGWVKIRVESLEGTFIVKLSSFDHAAAREILARARVFISTARPSLTVGDAAAAEDPLLPPH